MKIDGWLDTFKEIGEAASSEVKGLWGTPRAQQEIGRGAGGDTTVLIDKIMEDLIVERLKGIGDVRLISEERGLMEFGEPEVTVIADPVDGSFNAKMGIPLFTISLALVQGDLRVGNITLGYIRNLLNNDEYQAVKGKGSLYNGESISTTDLKDIRVIGMECHPNTVLALKQNLALVDDDTRLRCLGCISLDLCHVARGIFDTFIDVRGGQTRIVDIAASKLMVEEAGGTVSDGEGEGLDHVAIDVGTRIDLIASGNKGIHAKVLDILGKKGLLT